MDYEDLGTRRIDPKTSEAIRSYFAKQQGRRTLSDEVYLEFYREAIEFDLKDFEAQTEEKRELLIRYFPRRFGDGRKEPVNYMEPMQVGALFKNVVQYSGERAGQ